MTMQSQKHTENIPGDPPVTVKRFAWDGWEAVITNCPLVRATGRSPEEAVLNVLDELAQTVKSESQ